MDIKALTGQRIGNYRLLALRCTVSTVSTGTAGRAGAVPRTDKRLTHNKP